MKEVTSHRTIVNPPLETLEINTNLIAIQNLVRKDKQYIQGYSLELSLERSSSSQEYYSDTVDYSPVSWYCKRCVSYDYIAYIQNVHRGSAITSLQR